MKEAEAELAKAPEGVRAEGAAAEISYCGGPALTKVPTGVPVTVLTATDDPTMPADAKTMWIEKHKEWIATVPGGRHVVVQKDGPLHSGATTEARDSTRFERRLNKKTLGVSALLVVRSNLVNRVNPI
jgi:hypothetical protein